MAKRGRVWAVYFTVAMAAVSVGPLAAAPPLLSPEALQGNDSWKLPEIHPAPSRGREVLRSTRQDSNSSASASANVEVSEIPAGPVHQVPPSLDAFIASGRIASESTASSVVASDPAGLEKTGSWIAVLGDVARPGSHEVGADSITLAELLGRCGGVTSQSDCMLSLVRNGRCVGDPRVSQEMLRPGDLLVVTSREAARSTQDVRIGIVGLPGCPVAIKVPRTVATVEDMLVQVRQNHLAARDVKVLVGGVREVTGDKVIELTHGSVLVFDPGLAKQTGLDLQSRTYFYPAPRIPSGLDRTGLTQAALESPPPSRLESALALGPPADLQAPAARQSSGDLDHEFASSASSPDTFTQHDEISSLPSVEFLDPPNEMPALRFPRMADASGTTPIGAPEADSHIMPLPADATDMSSEPNRGSAKSTAGEPVRTALKVPEPVEISIEEEPETNDPSLVDLAPTIIIGGILGGLTFWVLRRFRSREAFIGLYERFAGAVRSKTAAGSASVSITPAPTDVLAALIADRLAFREEPVALPSAMRVHGRSPALQRRRIDPAAASLAAPHFPVQGSPHIKPSVATQQQPVASQSNDTRFRIDPAQSLKHPAPKRSTGTPFERALATLRDEQQSDFK